MSPLAFFSSLLHIAPELSLGSPPQSPRSTSSRRIKHHKVKIMVPEQFYTSLPVRPQKTSFLYENLTAEQKAKVAVINAFANSPYEFLEKYKVSAIVGFGGNGCVVSATETTEHGPLPVAIKIIYKVHTGKNQKLPLEILALRELNGVCTSTSVLRCLAAFQDSHHFYLVTELFGSDWLAHIPDSKRRNIIFNSKCGKEIRSHSLSFTQGNVDAWAWQIAHRRYMYQTTGIQLLPTEPVKHIIRECAKALSAIHEAGFYHGDVKLENILLEFPTSTFGNKSDAPKLMLADYGHCSKVANGIKRYGTEEVAPPEFLNDGPAFLDGRASDVFALGMVLCVLLSDHGLFPRAAKGTKRHGFKALLEKKEGRFPFDFRDAFSNGARELLNGMCMVDPDCRFTMNTVMHNAWLNSNDI
ncbi:kinase-like domain-containing protein [Obelidium mucronatum]|nr:kinase-like domain-containing protein [Obelidium mucronatum]